jgi:hypothetical protein
MVYTGAMPTTKQVRRSVTLPAQIAQQVERLAKRRRLSDNRVLVELIEQGIEATKQKEQMFFELAERFRSSKDPDVVKKLGDELGRFVFGDNAANRELVAPTASDSRSPGRPDARPQDRCR